MRMGDCFLCVLGFLSAKLRGSPLLPALRPDPQQLGGPPRRAGGEEPAVPGSAPVRETGLGVEFRLCLLRSKPVTSLLGFFSSF